MHAYPAQLADFVLDHWPATPRLDVDRRALIELLSCCYQASLAFEEGRPVRFRLVSARSSDIASPAGEDRFVPLALSEPIPLTPDSLRRFSPAAPFSSSVIGVMTDGKDWSIWGLVHTGAEWLAPTWGGRDRHLALSFPTVSVLGPGRLDVYAGAELVATLERGMIEATTTDVFTSKWLPALFRASRKRLAPADDRLNLADDTLVRAISQSMVRRAIFLIRQAGHGGMILFAETELIRECADDALRPPSKVAPRVNPRPGTVAGILKVKYSFAAGDVRERYRKLLADLMGALGPREPSGTADLQRYLDQETPDVNRVERSIFEISRLVAGLAAVDGAVVLSKRFDLIGFGAEVSGELPYPDTVLEALDVEAERRAPEAANSVGTRHRAAYRFVTAHPLGLAIVISHDGVVRFVANLDGKVVYWDQFLNW
jgi:hypothetical protein